MTRPQTAPPSPPIDRKAARWRFDPWFAAVAVIAALVALPIAGVAWLALFPDENIWPHLARTVLPRYVATTLWLMAGVMIGTVMIGVGAAWLTTTYRFPGQRVFGWALMLPLAVPAYVVAYVYTDLLEFAGPVQTALRAAFGWTSARDYWFPEIRSLGGAIGVMTLSLYPYVFLLARSAFVEQSAGVVEAARLLGCGPWGAFLRISVPMARPSIAIGVALAMMETLNDFGTVDFFSVQTLTAGLYNVWFTMNNAGGGAQVALVLLVFVVTMLMLERTARRRQRYFNTTSRLTHPPKVRLTGVRAGLATTACILPILLGFAVPAGLLLDYAIVYFEAAWSSRFPAAAANSLFLSAGAALIGVVIGVVLAYGLRVRGGRMMRTLARVAGLGYAIPGAVIAIGILIPFGAFDNALDGFLRDRFGISSGLLLSGTVFAVMFAYVVRFLALSFGTLEAGLSRVTPSMEMAARTLGLGPARTLIRVNLPIIRTSMLTAAILIFVDSMKELPATLILRPFNFDTLATYVYEFASDERLEESALGALAIVIVGILPVILLTETMRRRDDGQHPG
jgi:iron(III) transport system permease protein